MTTFITDLLFKLSELGKWLYDFCTSTITIGPWEVNILLLLGGIGLTALIIASLIKALVPLA